MRFICILYLFIVLTCIFTMVLTCFSRDSSLKGAEMITIDTNNNKVNIDTVQVINATVEDKISINRRKYEIKSNTQVDILNITDIDNRTILPLNCTKGNNHFAPHFFVHTNYDYSGMWNNSSLAIYLYHFSPLFKSHKKVERVYVYNNKEFIKAIIESYKKPYDIRHSTKSNFDALLNHYVKNLIREDDIGINISRKLLTSISVSTIYMDILRYFFKYPYNKVEIDNIVFNIMIPFRNKVHCILFDKERHEFCKKCMNETDLFECCSYEPYDEKTKLLGEQYIKNAAQVLNHELMRYIKGKGNKLDDFESVECFYDKVTEKLCHNFYQYLVNPEILMK